MRYVDSDMWRTTHQFIESKFLLQEIEKIEREAAESKRRAYITFVTDEIMKHGGDMGPFI